MIFKNLNRIKFQCEMIRNKVMVCLLVSPRPKYNLEGTVELTMSSHKVNMDGMVMWSPGDWELSVIASPCQCPLTVPPVSVPCQCPLSVPPVSAPCQCPLSVSPVSVPCQCPLSVPAVSAPCQCPLSVPPVHPPRPTQSHIYV